MAVERVSVPDLPAGFNPDKHAAKILAKVCEKKGDGWEVESYDPDAHRLTLTRQGKVIQTVAGPKGQTLTLALGSGTRPTDGDRIASKFEDANPGYTLTEFKPFLGQAVMTKLTPAERQARDATAYALGMKPYTIQVAARRGGGFVLTLPSYTPSKHDTKLDEVATTIVGKPGWYVVVDAKTLQVSMIPGELPTFDAVYHFDFASAPPVRTWDKDGDKKRLRIDLAMALGGNGVPNQSIVMDLDDSIGALSWGSQAAGKRLEWTPPFLSPFRSAFRMGGQQMVSCVSGMTFMRRTGR